MFLFKKIVAPFLFPLPLTLLLLLSGLVLVWFTTRKRAGKILLTLATLFFIFCTYGFGPDLLLGPVENRYPPYTPPPALSTSGEAPAYVVVLGGGHISDPRLPLTSQINAETLKRLVEGIRLQRLLPGSKLVLSGGSVIDPVANAEIMARLAQEIGVPAGDIILESDSRDTKDEARLLQPLLGQKPFLLVTSASHMPRAMALFQNLQMNPIPAPTAHWVIKGAKPPLWISIFPSISDLIKTHRAIYEYLGLVWARLRGQA